jgi:hypothetical protein
MLNPNAKLARFTFNSPAERRYLSPEINGLRLKIDQSSLHLRPTPANKGNDVIEVASRSQGGRTADLAANGSSSKLVMQILTRNGFSPDKPFFILEEHKRGWLRIQHHPETTPPSKTIPFIRIWPLLADTKVDGERSPAVTTFDMRAWRSARRTVLRAVAIVREFDANHQGPNAARPTRLVTQAKEIVASFTSLVGEVAVAARKETRRGRRAAVGSTVNGKTRPILSNGHDLSVQQNGAVG